MPLPRREHWTRQGGSTKSLILGPELEDSQGQTGSLQAYQTHLTDTAVNPQIPDQRCCISEIVSVVPLSDVSSCSNVCGIASVAIAALVRMSPRTPRTGQLGVPSSAGKGTFTASEAIIMISVIALDQCLP